MRSRSGTVRRVQATHNRPKLREVVGERYGYQPSSGREPVSSCSCRSELITAPASSARLIA